MSDIALRVRDIGKRYRIGVREQGYKTFREALVDAAVGPIKNLKRLRSLTKFETGNGEGAADDIIWALKDVSFDVKEGEVVGIIGANGAGKSTLLKILSRITEPTTGYFKIKGRVSSLLEVGTGFHPELTGRENVYLNAAVLGMRKKEIDRKFDEIVDFSGVEKFIDTPVKRYSSGMQVRLAFAVAAHIEPEVLIVDEVLAVGDAAFQKKCLGKMGDVAKEGRTVLFVSHNMDAIMRLCGPAVWLNQGVVKLRSDARSVVQSYLSEGTKFPAIRYFNQNASQAGQVTKVQLSDSKGSPTTQFSFMQPITIEIEYTLRNILRNHRVGVAVSNQEGIDLLVTNSTDWHEGFQTAGPGDYSTTVQIPAPFLAPGKYLLSIYLGEPNVLTHDRHQNVIGLEIMASPSGITAQRRGFLLYPFEWKTTKHIVGST